MDSLVGIQVGLGTEGSFTFGALIGPLARVDPEVHNELRPTTEGLPTFVTYTVFFYAMSSLMLKKA